MDFDSALIAHIVCKAKFRDAVVRQETIDPAVMGNVPCCELGTWLSGEGHVKYGTKPHFNDLITKHAAFHQEAEAVAKISNRGERINLKMGQNCLLPPYN